MDVGCCCTFFFNLSYIFDICLLFHRVIHTDMSCAMRKKGSLGMCPVKNDWCAELRPSITYVPEMPYMDYKDSDWTASI